MSVTIDASEVIFVTESSLDVTTSTISEDARDSKFTLALGKKKVMKTSCSRQTTLSVDSSRWLLLTFPERPLP